MGAGTGGRPRKIGSAARNAIFIRYKLGVAHRVTKIARDFDISEVMVYRIVREESLEVKAECPNPPPKSPSPKPPSTSTFEIAKN